ncbi:MAG: AAA family ATPase [Ruminococcus sp.]|nr:AAA family ATPase [Ruminococcus sp.]
MITISLLNRKGGAGKTTASVNLAAIFAEMKNKKVLLVDFDPQANATTYLDKFISKDEVSVYDVLCEDLDINKAIIDTDIANLKLIPSNVNLDKADTYLTTLQMAKEYILKNKLSKIADEYDYVIIDCPPARNNLTTNALTASDYTVLPCEATEYGIDSIFAMNEFISNIQQYVNSNLKVAGILFTKKENTTAQKFYVEQFREALKTYHFFDTEIRKTTVVEKSLTEHQPLIIYSKKEEVTKDYIKVADELERIIKGENN